MPVTRLPLFAFLALLALPLLGGCRGNAGPSVPALSAYRITVAQGNILDAADLSRLERGMDRERVRLLLGTPLVDDPFTSDRWDYVFNLRRGYDARLQRVITVVFRDDRLHHIEGTLVPDPEAREQALAEEARTTVYVPPAAPEELGFWGKLGDAVGLVDPPPQTQSQSLASFIRANRTQGGVMTESPKFVREQPEPPASQAQDGQRPRRTAADEVPARDEADEEGDAGDNAEDPPAEEPGLFDGLLDRS